jgi:phosphatidate cytidylyltransferase
LFGAVGLAALSALRVLSTGLAWVYCVLIVTWANDTCAYFAGRFLGKHKLYPAVSPNKTWEGFAGGMVGSVAGMFIARATFFPDLSPADCLLVGFIGGVFGPLGDFCESMIKRAYGVKDSGNVIPGHGGLLDRVDALLFNAPLIYAYVAYFRALP